MGAGRATAHQQFPPLFGPYDRTELLGALLRDGPIRTADVKRAFSLETGRSVKREKSNVANLLTTSPAFIRQGGRDLLIGINPRCLLIGEIHAVIQVMSMKRQPRTVENDVRDGEAEFFKSAEHPEVNHEALFGTLVRTRTLVALHLLGGEETLGRLQRTVLHHEKQRVLAAVNGYVEEGVLANSDGWVTFNDALPWMPELRGLLEALSRLMPDARAHVAMMQAIRALGKSRTAHVHGTYFRLFGSRVNQGILAYLAAHGPSMITRICAEVNAVDVHAADPLIRAGFVCEVVRRDGRSTRILSLNAANPIYPELRALLRTEAMQMDAFPICPPTSMYIGDDLREKRERFLPYSLFGVEHQVISTKVLAHLVQTDNAETDASSLKQMLGTSQKDANGVQTIGNALRRLERYGVLSKRRFKTMLLYPISEDYAGFREFVDLLMVMGRVWPEFRVAGELESILYSENRSAMELGRTSAYGDIGAEYLNSKRRS